MKPYILIFSSILLILNFNFCFSQIKSSDHSQEEKKKFLQEVVSKSDLVIEGHIIGGKCFKTPQGIFTSSIIRLQKIFKGNIKDSIIEVICEGGSVDGTDVTIYDGGEELQEEGIFFLNNNITGIKLKTNIQSYRPANLRMIGYHNHIHRAVWGDVPYDDIENDIYQSIEATTGQKRIIVGKNMFGL